MMSSEPLNDVDFSPLFSDLPELLDLPLLPPLLLVDDSGTLPTPSLPEPEPAAAIDSLPGGAAAAAAAAWLQPLMSIAAPVAAPKVAARKRTAGAVDIATPVAAQLATAADAAPVAKRPRQRGPRGGRGGRGAAQQPAAAATTLAAVVDEHRTPTDIVATGIVQPCARLDASSPFPAAARAVSYTSPADAVFD